MKFLLISLNILLVAAVCHLAWTYSSDPLEFASTSRKMSPAKVERKKSPKVKASERYVGDSPEVTEKKIAALVEHNIFKTERVPDAPANKTAQRNTQQIRADMSLVGTYVIGDSLGAIILQRLQGNAQQQLKALQQKEYEQYTASSTRITDPKKRAAAAAAAAAADEDDAEGAAAGKENKAQVVVDAEIDPKQIVIVGGSPTISANNVFRQHLKVGDTTVTGYKLEEVTRTSAVLTKNNERIELTLLTPSEAGNVARNNQNRNNNNNNQNRNNNNNNNNNQNRNNNNNNNARNNNNNNNRNNNNANARNNNNNNNRNNNNQNRNNNNNRNNRDEFEWF